MKFFKLLYRATGLFIKTRMANSAAAFSYYATFALIPSLFFSVSVVGFFYGSIFTAEVFTTWVSILGYDLMNIIQIALNNLHQETSQYQVPLIGGMFLLGFYVIAFNLMANAFQRLWGRESGGLKNWLIKSLRSFIFLFIIQGYLIGLIALEFFAIPILFGDSSWLGSLILFAGTMVFFILLYRLLATGSPSWSGCVRGAAVSSILFVGVKTMIHLYVANSAVLGLYGAAGLILILLVWIYFTAALIFYGAAVAGLYDKIKLNSLLINKP